MWLYNEWSVHRVHITQWSEVHGAKRGRPPQSNFAQHGGQGEKKVPAGKTVYPNEGRALRSRVDDLRVS